MLKPFGSLVVTPLHAHKGVHILHLTVLNTFSMVLTWKICSPIHSLAIISFILMTIMLNLVVIL